MRISRVVLALGFTILLPSIAKAATITLDEAGLDAIFSQASFGSVPVDIRILQPQVISNPALLDIETQSEMFSQLLALSVNPSPVVNAYFVDSMSDTACGGFVLNLWGCSQIGGNNFAVESTPAAGSRGTALVAHELGHTLSLLHFNDPNRLMNPVVSFNIVPLLSAAEVATILSSPFVQADPFSGARFIEIGPVVVTDTAPAPVPEPGTLLLVSTGLAAAGFRRRILARAASVGPSLSRRRI
jgi:hypothetical protein